MTKFHELLVNNAEILERDRIYKAYLSCVGHVQLLEPKIFQLPQKSSFWAVDMF